MTPTDPTLAGWYVISLRPSGGHDPVRRAAVARGARLLPLSTLRLVPLSAGPALAAAMACPRVVFTSPAAVRFAAALQPLRAEPGRQEFAVGAGTAGALKRAGLPGAISPPTGGDAETLLALPGLQGPGPVGLVTAPGGRLGQLAMLPPSSALLVSSGEAFEALWAELAEGPRALLRGRPVVASSPRLAVLLAAAGFATIVSADSTVPARMLAALAADVAAGRFR